MRSEAVILAGRIGWGPRQATAAVVLLIALSTCLLVLAKPVDRAVALGLPDTNSPTDVTQTAATQCAADGVAATGRVRITLAGTASDGNPVGQPGMPVGVQIQLLAAGQTGFQAPAAGAAAPYNLPSYVLMSGADVNVWLAGVLDPAGGQSLLIQADGFTAELLPFTPPTSCTAGIAPTDFSLATPVADTITATSCDTVAATATISTTLTNPTTDPALLALYTSARLPHSTPAVTPPSVVADISDGVFVTDTSGTIVSPPTSSLADFALANPTDPASMVASVALSTFSAPATGLLTDYQIWVVDPEGQTSAQPLLDVTTGVTIDCTPPPPPTTAAPVIPPTTDSTTPVTTTTTTSTATTTDAQTPPPVTSSSSLTASSPPTSPTSSPSSSAPPVTSQPETTPASVAPVQVTTPPGDVQQTTPLESVSNSPAVASSTPPTTSSPATILPTGLAASEIAAAQASSFEAAASAASAASNPAATVTLSATEAKLAVPTNGPLAESLATIKPVQILRWHQDAAIVVGFDALAIFSLVGATVWSARRR